jgi:hypothetical protein
MHEETAVQFLSRAHSRMDMQSLSRLAFHRMFRHIDRLYRTAVLSRLYRAISSMKRKAIVPFFFLR